MRRLDERAATATPLLIDALANPTSSCAVGRPSWRGESLMQECAETLHLGLRDGLGAWIAFENRQGRRPRGIGKDLRECGEQHHQQGVDLICVAHHVIAELLL